MENSERFTQIGEPVYFQEKWCWEELNTVENKFHDNQLNRDVYASFGGKYCTNQVRLTSRKDNPEDKPLYSDSLNVWTPYETEEETVNEYDSILTIANREFIKKWGRDGLDHLLSQIWSY